METQKLRRTLGGALLALSLAACSSPAEVDDATLLAELKAVGVEPINGITEWREVMRPAVCEGSDLALELSLTLSGTTQGMIDATRIAAKHFCPERLPILEDAKPQT